MAKEQKRFLKRLREKWKTEFPFLKPVDLDEVPKIPKGCNFRCDDYFPTRGVFYYVTFDFSLRRVGEFSLGASVSRSAEKSIFDPVNTEPGPTSIGMYTIAQFMGCQRFCWEIVDVDAKLDEFLTSVGATDLRCRQRHDKYLAPIFIFPSV